MVTIVVAARIVIGVIVFFCALSYLIPRFVDRRDAARMNKKRKKQAQAEMKKGGSNVN